MKFANPAQHLVLRARHPHRPWLDRPFCVQTWNYLERVFPKIYGAILMPNHFHILPEWEAEHIQRAKLQDVQRYLSRHFLKSVWETGTIETIPDRHHLKRQLRYVHLNPTRKGLCDDPLSWEWSTHLDYLGLILNPWVRPTARLKELGFPGTDASSRFHAYVSGDPSVRIAGSPSPRDPGGLYTVHLPSASAAAEIALRIDSRELRKKGNARSQVVRVLSTTSGLPKAKIADYFGINRSVLSRYPETASPADQRLAKAIRLILNDPRTFPSRPFPSPPGLSF